MVYPVSSRLPADCATQVDGASRLQSPRSSWSARLDLSCVPHPMVIDKKQTCIEEWTEGKSTITQTQQSHKRIHGFWQLRTSSIQHASPKSEKKRKNPCKRGKLTSLNPIFERSHNKNKQKKKKNGQTMAAAGGRNNNQTQPHGHGASGSVIFRRFRSPPKSTGRKRGIRILTPPRWYVPWLANRQLIKLPKKSTAINQLLYSSCINFFQLKGLCNISDCCLSYTEIPLWKPLLEQD